MLEYARGDSDTPPRPLVWYWNSQRWGLPHGGGWADQPADMWAQMTYAGTLYEAAAGYAAAKIGERARWKADHPYLWEMLREAEEIVNESEAENGE